MFSFFVGFKFRIVKILIAESEYAKKSEFNKKIFYKTKVKVRNVF